jgi:ribose 5-phosphate isomerase A
MTAAERALEFVEAGNRIGLGTGHAASAFARALASRVHRGFDVRAVPTSRAIADEARSLGIPLTTLDDVEWLDVTVDGADEVDPRLDLIKGYGGALLRERVVAASSRLLVIVVGREKLVPALGARGIVPVEVVPFAVPFCRKRLAELGMASEVRTDGRRPFLTDNDNYLLHCAVGPLPDPAGLFSRIRAIPGVVEAGLFLGMADVVVVQAGDQVNVLHRSRGGKAAPLAAGPEG